MLALAKKIVKTQAVGKSMLVVLSTKTQMLLNCYDLNAKLLQFPLVESPVLWLLKFPYIILFVKISLVPVTKKTLRKNNLFCMASILISIIIFISKEGKSSQSGKSPCFLPNFPTSPPGHFSLNQATVWKVRPGLPEAATRQRHVRHACEVTW